MDDGGTILSLVVASEFRTAPMAAFSWHTKDYHARRTPIFGMTKS